MHGTTIKIIECHFVRSFSASECYEKEHVRMVGIGAIREGELKFVLLVNGGIHILKK
jgi:hypothetical protein